MKGVSVIICCYNSAARIRETLYFLGAQKVPPGLPWEIVVVNNASTDNTIDVVTECKATLPRGVTLKITNEDTPGLASARQKGIQESAYDIIIFCDDDNHLEEPYISEAYRIMSMYPDVAIAGGEVKPKFNTYPGKWIEGNYPALAIGRQALENGDVDWVFGAGMVVRKNLFEVFKEKGLSLMLSGRLGSKQTSGDDAEMCQLARFLGFRIYYSSGLVLHHKIAEHRLSRSSFIKANYKNVFPIVYFHILDRLIHHPETSPSTFYWNFLKTRVFNTFYFFPRIFFGKYPFFSFMMFFQNIQLCFWLVFRRKAFFNVFQLTKMNLYAKS